jgi:hypothetical protein
MAEIPIGQDIERYFARAKAEWTNDVILALLGMISPQEAATIRNLIGTGRTAVAGTGPLRVTVAPPVPQDSPVTVSPPVGTYGTVDQAVGNPEVNRPALALYATDYPQVLYRRDRPVEIPSYQDGGIIPTFIDVRQVGAISFSGAIDVGSSAQVLYVTWDAGSHWFALTGNEPFPAGSAFSYTVPVAPGDKVGFGPGQASVWDRVLITFSTRLPEPPPQGQFGAVPTAVPGVAPYPAAFVPVSAFPQIIASATVGTQLTAGQPIGSPFSVPAPGIVGVFGWIESGSAFFTLSVENVNGTPQFGALNGGSNQVQGAWVAATIAVNTGDTVAVSVSANCTLGSVRVTYTPSS